MHSPTTLHYRLAAAAFAALAMWALAKFVGRARRDRLLADTPLVKIRSAAQGYVKVFGRAKNAGDVPIAAPLSGRPCVWWSYSVDEKRENSKGESVWLTVDGATSVTPFALADADAECLVGPVNAEITPTSHDVWYGDKLRPNCLPVHTRGVPGFGGNYRYTERLLGVGDRLSVTGELRSNSEIESAGTATAAMLRQWKLDQAALLARFDCNHDGRIDAAEWETARNAAAAEAQAGMLKASIVRTSVIGEPTHGEPFLIASMDSARLVLRERLLALWFFVIGVVSAALCAWALQSVRS
jgi:hypothetical protein